MNTGGKKKKKKVYIWTAYEVDKPGHHTQRGEVASSWAPGLNPYTSRSALECQEEHSVMNPSHSAMCRRTRHKIKVLQTKYYL